MSVAANYVSEYSTSRPEYKGRAENAENIIYQLSATKKMQKRAVKNLQTMRKSISGHLDETAKDRMHQTVKESKTTRKTRGLL